MAVPVMAWGQTSLPQAPANCNVYEVKSLPGSHHFAADFLETMVGDPKDPNVVWGLTADLSDTVPAPDRALYISKSSNGGKIWTQVARIDSRYFDAGIAEGLRNGWQPPRLPPEYRQQVGPVHVLHDHPGTTVKRAATVHRRPFECQCPRPAPWNRLKTLPSSRAPPA